MMRSSMMSFQAAPATLPPGRRIYAVGDVHGHLDRLAAMHALIAQDLRDRPVPAPLLLHLGDYLDRGPDSAGVVARLLDPAALPPAPVVNLMGNHEDMALCALGGQDEAAIPHWLANGGVASLRSWNVGQDTHPHDWASRLPPAHLAFLRSLAFSHREGGYLFVHAGVRPGVPAARQAPHDLLWVREPFLSWTGAWDPRDPFVVVHGHTPVPEAVVRPNRIGLDTGAGHGRALTCAVLEADRLALLQT
jgi:serine/threonine protein phosphatase 1